MEPRLRHRWDLSPAEAIALQRRLAARIEARGELPRAPFLVAGCDAAGGSPRTPHAEEIIAGVVVLRVPGLEIVAWASARGPAPFPYIPGLLSFREVPLYLEAFDRLTARPDLLLCDGQGIAHPRGLGLAAHLGLLLDLPSVGVAKSRLVGEHREPGERRGCSARLLLEGRCVGRVLRTQTGVRPLYVSPGHRLGIEEAARATLALTTRYRLPEPTRIADRWVARLRRDPRAEP